MLWMAVASQPSVLQNFLDFFAGKVRALEWGANTFPWNPVLFELDINNQVASLYVSTCPGLCHFEAAFNAGGGSSSKTVKSVGSG